MIRQIALDTETTGLRIEDKHRIIEIAAVELYDRKITGKIFHTYLNPHRPVDTGAFRIHGLSDDFLKKQKNFVDIAEDFMNFIADSELIIHNAVFDVSFLNYELLNIAWPMRIADTCKIFDTLIYVREKHAGQRNNLDALCKRYDVSNSHRKLHGALLDAELLALVYLAMTGGQIELFADEHNIFESATSSSNVDATVVTDSVCVDDTVVIMPTAEELQQHQDLMHFIQQRK